MGQAESAFYAVVGFGKYLFRFHWLQARYWERDLSGFRYLVLAGIAKSCGQPVLVILSQRHWARKGNSD